MAEAATSADGAATRVFISYSRRDLEMAEALRERLIAEGLDAFLDTHDIVKGEPWRDRLRTLIARADVVLFLISPDSVRSEICDWEVNEAELLAKRIAPAVCRETPMDEIPARLQRLNLAFLRTPEEIEREFPALAAAIRQDATWVREHSRLGELARRWDDRGRPSRLLLRGADIAAAENWRAARGPSAPPLSALHEALLTESRRASARRQRWWIGGVSAIAAVTAALAVVAFLQRQAAVTAAQQAQRNFAAAEQALNSLIFDITQDLKDVEGISAAAIRRILGQARTTAETLLDNDPNEPRLLRVRLAMLNEFAEVYQRTGDVEDARLALDESVAIGRRLAGQGDDRQIVQFDAVEGAIPAEQRGPLRDLAVALELRSDLALRLGDPASARALFDESHGLRRALIVDDPTSLTLRRDLSVSLGMLGDFARREGALDEARAAYQEALGLRRELSADQPGDQIARRDVAITLDALGDLRRAMREPEGAESAYEESVEIFSALQAEEPENVGYLRDVSAGLAELGLVRFQRGDLGAAEAAYQQSAETFRRIAELEPDNLDHQRNLSVILERLSDLRAQSDAIAAMAAIEQSVAIRRGLAAREPDNTLFARDVTLALVKLGDRRRQAGEQAGSRAAFEEALSNARAVANRAEGDVDAQTDLALALLMIGRISEGAAQRSALVDARAILAPLAEGGRLAADKLRWLPMIDALLADLPAE